MIFIVLFLLQEEYLLLILKKNLKGKIKVTHVIYILLVYYLCLFVPFSFKIGSYCPYFLFVFSYRRIF